MTTLKHPSPTQCAARTTVILTLVTCGTRVVCGGCLFDIELASLVHICAQTLREKSKIIIAGRDT